MAEIEGLNCRRKGPIILELCSNFSEMILLFGCD